MKARSSREQLHLQRSGLGTAQRHLPTGVGFLYPEESVFEAMLDGWATQMTSRSLSLGTIEDRVRRVRRLAAYTNDYPWNWYPADLEDWSSSLRSQQKPVVHSTLRGYQHDIAMFMDYLTDDRYGWGDECEQQFGTFPIQIYNELNMVSHGDGYEGRPEVRPLSRRELQDFFDFCDDRVATIKELGRKGWLAAFRDATIFKVIYAWGLRRTEAAMLDLLDFGPNAVAPEFGEYGSLVVRHGKSMAGSPPKRRSVSTVWKWAAEAVQEYVDEICPVYGYAEAAPRHREQNALERAMWPTERDGRVSPDHLTMRFASYREELGLPEELTLHCLRHSYITHLIEDGWEHYFVQDQVGHNWGSTTSLYTGVSSDFKNHLLRKSLDRISCHPESDAANGLNGDATSAARSTNSTGDGLKESR